MDLFSLGFLLLILVASGVVAFLADRLGKKLGKKRLSIWGLRPKHVAALGTVVMGVVVSALTIALVAAASTDARTWLREGRDLLIQRDRLRRDKRQLETEKDRLTRESKELENANSDLKGTNRLLEKAIDDLKNSLKAERGSLAKAQKQRERVVIEAARLVREKSSLDRKVTSLKATLTQAKLALTTSQSEVASNRLTLKQVRANLDRVQGQIQVAKRDLETSGLNLSDAQNKLQLALKKGLEVYTELLRLQGEVNKGEVRVAELVAEREEAERKLIDAQKQFATVQTRLDSAGKELVQLQQIAQSQLVFLNDTFKTSRTEALTFRIGEEVTRVPVPGGADSKAASAALNTLLRSARIAAENRGAKSKRIDDKFYEIADIFDRSDRKTSMIVTAEMLKQAVIARAAGRIGEQVLVATSSLNAFSGEPVSLEVAVLPNPVIYHQNDALSEARIDGTLTEDRIFAQISEFVRSRVRERAIQDRMIPRANTDAPFGEVPTLDVFNLVREVKRAGRVVRVQAVAAADIRAAEPLRLEFRLK